MSHKSKATAKSRDAQGRFSALDNVYRLGTDTTPRTVGALEELEEIGLLAQLDLADIIAAKRRFPILASKSERARFLQEGLSFNATSNGSSSFEQGPAAFADGRQESREALREAIEKNTEEMKAVQIQLRLARVIAAGLCFGFLLRDSDSSLAMYLARKDNLCGSARRGLVRAMTDNFATSGVDFSKESLEIDCRQFGIFPTHFVLQEAIEHASRGFREACSLPGCCHDDCAVALEELWAEFNKESTRWVSGNSNG